MISFFTDQLIPGFGIMSVFNFFPGVGTDHVRYKILPGEFSKHMQDSDSGAIHIGKADRIGKGVNSAF